METTVRQIDSIRVWETGSEVNAGNDNGYVDQTGKEIVIRVTGRGFLYNMVRIIAGTLMEIGRGHIEPKEMEKIIAARDRQAAGPTAPACGLTLINIEYL